MTDERLFTQITNETFVMPFKQDNKSKRFFNCYKFITIQYRYKTVTDTAEILIIWLKQFIVYLSSDMLSENLDWR